ncbi:MAG: SDR family NAD(P)-dependent oxidoreductase [Nitrososphaerales archaeon]
MNLGLTGRKALVTGGSAGIGLAIARTLLREGVAVGICARNSSRLDEAAAHLQKNGGTAVGVVADVTVPDQVQNAVKEVAEQIGGLDMVVACAGGHIGEPWLMKNTSSDWAGIFQLNVVHSVDVVRAAVPYMRDSGRGAALLISSITGWRPGPSSAYAAAKAALIHLAATLAQELGPYGIRVNSLSPGSTADTGGWLEYRHEHPEEFARFEREELPLGHLVNVQQVADAACFVLSPTGAGINGANIAVDAGQYRPHAIRFPRDV